MKRILIGEPDKQLRTLYCEALHSLGYDAEQAGDGLECVAKLRTFHPNLMILEPDLPWGSGEGVLACLGEEGIPTVPVVLVGHQVKQRLLTGLESRIQDRYDKPLAPARLAEVVKRFLAQPNPEPYPDRDRPTVLLVEDEKVNRKLMRDILDIRFQVVEADSAEKALALLGDLVPDLILLDVQLPGMDGLTCKDLLTAMPHLSQVPVVAVSAHAMPQQIEEGKKHGFVEYVTKPIVEDPDVFADRLANLCEQSPDLLAAQ